MLPYVSIALCVVLLPGIYWGTMQLVKVSFEKEENKSRKPLASKLEKIIMVISEIALFRIWIAMGRCTLDNMMFELVFFMLAGITVLCMTDYWERIVPNKVLLIWLMIFILIVGFHALFDMDAVLDNFPMIILGLAFCLIVFGLAYVISHGSLGAGDVKLSFLMGVFLSSEYVVGAVLYGCILSMIFSIVQIVRKKLTRKDTLPFVPFLYIGLIIRYLIG